RRVLFRSFFGRHVKGLVVARFQPNQVGFEVLRQVLVTDLQGGGLLIEGGVHGFTVFKLEGEVERYPGSLVDRQFFHSGQLLLSASPLLSAGLRNTSRIIMAAPMVMAVSARLKAGKCQSCQ